MKIHNGNKLRIEEFNSFGEYIRLAKGNESPQSSNKEERNDWSGCENLKEACDLATHGWDAVRPEVDNLLADLEPRLADAFGEYYVTRHDVAGSFVDVGAYVTGEPECMVEFVPEPDSRMGRVIKIAVAGTASASISPEHIRLRGVAVLALVDVIHKMGLGIELWWDSTIEGNDRTDHSTAVKLHDSAEPLDINTVMFALAHPSMLRRLQFSVQEQSKTAKAQGVGGGYGYPSSMGIVRHDKFDVVVEKLQDGRGDIVADPFKWVVSTVTGLGLIAE
jgi:hypothetical protein